MVEGFYTTAEAAKELGFTDGARIRQMILEGTITKFEKVSANLILIPIKEVERIKKIERKPGRPKKSTK